MDTARAPRQSPGGSWPTDVERAAVCEERAGQVRPARTPRVIREPSRRDQWNGKRSAIVRHSEVRAVDGEHVGGHVWVNIAEDSTEPWLVEHYRLLNASRIETEIELLSVAKREDVVEHPIVVRKVHGSADAHGEHVRREAQVALVEDGTFHFAARRRIGRLQPDDGIRLRPIAGARSSAQIDGRRADG